MEAYKLTLIAIFGRGSKRPWRAVLFRLGCIFLLANMLGWLLTIGLDNVPFNPHEDDIYLALLAACVVQSAVLFALLAALGVIRADSRDALARQLIILPLPPTQRWGALLLPSFILAGVALTVTSWPLLLSMSRLGLPPIAFGAASLVGFLAALGAVHGFPRRRLWLQIIVLPVALGAELLLLKTLPTASWYAMLGASLALAGLLAASCWYFWRSRDHIVQDMTAARSGRGVIASSLPPATWFIKKVVRARGTRLGLITTLLLSAGLSWLFDYYSIDAQAALMLASILIASFASDVRSLCGRHQPAEITNLRGTARFICGHIGVASLCSVLAVAPLLFQFAQTAALQPVHAAQLLLAVSAGVFAGTLLVPAHRDVLSQLLATLLCGAILVAVPAIPASQSLQPAELTVLHLSIATVLMSLAVAIEYRRNNYYWRKS